MTAAAISLLLPLLLLLSSVYGARPPMSALQKTCMKNKTSDFIHPGLMHSLDDFEFVRFWVSHGYEPYKSGWDRLIHNWHAITNYIPRPFNVTCRGNGPCPQNYGTMYRDAAGAYQHALLWKISGDDKWAKSGTNILNTYANVVKVVSGTGDAVLLAGLQGYQFATAAEIFRTWPGWKPAEFQNVVDWLLRLFWKINREFLSRPDLWAQHFWSNWELCSMCSALAIGALADRPDIYNFAMDYWFNGAGTGGINHTLWVTYPDGTAQDNESGRDQGHATLSMALELEFVQMAYTQGCDLFSYDDNRVLKGAEYMAKYNLGYNVSFTPLRTPSGWYTPVISSASRGIVRPMWELPYNHYRYIKNVPYDRLKYTAQFAAMVRPEGGGGQYGENSGGYDQTGFGTLMYSRVIPNATLWDAYLRNKTRGRSSKPTIAVPLLNSSNTSTDVPPEATDAPDTALQSATESQLRSPTVIASVAVLVVAIIAIAIVGARFMIQKRRQRKNPQVVVRAVSGGAAL